MAGAEAMAKDSEEVTHETLMDLSGNLFKEWRDVGRNLKLAETELDNIEADNRRKGQKELVYHMLLLWKRKHGMEATNKTLRDALIAAYRKGLSDYLLNREQCGTTSDSYVKTALSVQAVVGKEGRILEIPGTGVRLDIPPGAIDGKCLIEMKIISNYIQEESTSSFASNSTVVVELLPDNVKLHHRAKLTLPHCLKLKNPVECKAMVFSSHHDQGTQPKWRPKQNALYQLNETNCIIWVESFSWKTCQIDDRDVEFKKIQVYAACSQLPVDPSTNGIHMELGYYIALPGKKEIIEKNDMKILQEKPFPFFKEGQYPLKILLEKIRPESWKCTEDTNPKELSFRKIAMPLEDSCPFSFDKVREEDCTFYFKATQEETIELRVPYKMDIRIPGRMSAKSSSLKPISEATNTTVEQQEDKGNDVPSKRNDISASSLLGIPVPSQSADVPHPKKRPFNESTAVVMDVSVAASFPSDISVPSKSGNVPHSEKSCIDESTAEVIDVPLMRKINSSGTVHEEQGSLIGTEATNTTVEQQEDKSNNVPSKRNMEFRLPGRMSAKSSSLKPISDKTNKTVEQQEDTGCDVPSKGENPSLPSHQAIREAEGNPAGAEAMTIDSEEVTNETLQDLSGKFSKEWQDVGRNLKLDKTELKNIMEDYRSSGQREVVYHMLLLWTRKHGMKATNKTLRDALKATDRKDLSDYLLNREQCGKTSEKDKTNKTVEQQEDKRSDVSSKGKSKIKSSGTVREEQGSMIETDNLPSNPLQMELLINKDGGVLELPDTGVSLEIPPGALEKDQLIQMRIIPYNFQGDSDLSFSSNSSVVVELLPSNLKLLKPVKLTLPHCLVLKKGCEWKAKIYSSHHEEGTHPLWEPQPDTPYLLNQGNCIIELRTFSWEKFVIDNEVVEGKRIVLYAAKHLPSHKAIVHIDVGFYLDLVGGEENVSMNKVSVLQKKSALFLKKGRLPLKFYLVKTEPPDWNFCPDERNPKEIPFIRAAISIGSYCTFVFNKKGTMETDKFSCYFKAGQENLTDLTVVLEDISASSLSGIPVPSQSADVPHPKTIRFNESTAAVMAVSVAASSLSDSSVPSKSGNVPHSEKRCMDKSTAKVKDVPMMGVSTDPLTDFSVPSKSGNVPHSEKRCIDESKAEAIDVPMMSKITSSGTVHEKQGSMIGTGTHPLWEPQPDPHVLNERNCNIKLRTFGWQKLDNGDEIVDGKSIVLYAAKQLPSDKAKVHIDVGYYWDLEGCEESVSTMNKVSVLQKKSALLLREGKFPLKFYFVKTEPPDWKFCSDDEENPKDIPFIRAANLNGGSCTFVFKKKGTMETDIYSYYFKAGQESDLADLTFLLQDGVEDSAASSSDKLVDAGLSQSQKRTGDESQTVNKPIENIDLENPSLPSHQATRGEAKWNPVGAEAMTKDSEVVKDSTLWDLSKNLTKEWRDVGRELKLTETYLRRVEADYRDDGQKEVVYQMLLLWKKTTGEAATNKTLIDALREAGLQMLHDNFLKCGKFEQLQLKALP